MFISIDTSIVLRLFSMVRRTVVLAALILAVATVATLAQSPALAQVLDPKPWFPDGSVKAVAVSGNTAYFGGFFSRLYPLTGGGAVLNSGTGEAAAPYAGLRGVVYAAVSDGAGGWYVGGAFTEVQGQPRTNLAHLDGAGLLTSWNPGANDVVRALVTTANDVIVGGQFSVLGGLSRGGLGAVDRASGVTTGWNPGVSGWVFAMAVNGSSLHIGGLIIEVAGQPRANLAVVDLVSGALGGWNPGTNDIVEALALRGSMLYVGGSFTMIGGQPRTFLAAVDATSGAVAAWNPNPDAGVTALRTTQRLIAPGNITVYVAGYFTQLGGQPRNTLGSVDGGTGLATTWNPAPDLPVTTLSLRTSNSTGEATTIYVGGEFRNIGGQPRKNIAALASTGLATAWDPGASDKVHLVSYLPSNGMVFVGGQFNGAGGQPRQNVAAIDLATGAPTPWNPGVNGDVRALAVYGSDVYMGGEFSSVGGQPRYSLAAVDGVSGVPTAFQPQPIKQAGNGEVNAIEIRAGLVYAGGAFFAIGGQLRDNLAALDPATGSATTWDPDADGVVSALATTQRITFPNEVTVYAGGDFCTIGGQVRCGMVGLDGATGMATAFNPAPDYDVRSILIAPNPLTGAASTIYVGGDFLNIGGQARSHIAALTAGGVATAWDPQSSNYVVDLAFHGGSKVLAAGNFASIGGAYRTGVAELDAVTGGATDWNPAPTNDVNAVVWTGDAVYLGGAFPAVLGQPRPNFARLSESLVAVESVPAGGAGARGGAIALAAVPNPFRGEAGGDVAISFSLPAAAAGADVAIHDLAGRRVRALHAGTLPPGETRLAWDGRDDGGARVAAGIYFVRVRAGAMGGLGKLVRL